MKVVASIALCIYYVRIRVILKGVTVRFFRRSPYDNRRVGPIGLPPRTYVNTHLTNVSVEISIFKYDFPTYSLRICVIIKYFTID